MFICHTRQRSTGAESPGSFVKEWPLIKGGGIGTDGDRQTCSLNHPYFVDFEPPLSCLVLRTHLESRTLTVQSRFSVLFAQADQLSKARPSRLPFLSPHPLHPHTQLTLRRDKRWLGTFSSEDQVMPMTLVCQGSTQTSTPQGAEARNPASFCRCSS